MAEQGEHGISWTDTTWNPVRGCKSRKGGDPAEWPATLRVQEYPR